MGFIDNQKHILTQKIKELGYENLRFSIFSQKDENRVEWQTRIEYDEKTKEYQVYSLADRASLIGKISNYLDYESAEERFLRKLELTVKYNKLRVQNGEKPEYPCSLWDK